MNDRSSQVDLGQPLLPPQRTRDGGQDQGHGQYNGQPQWHQPQPQQAQDWTQNGQPYQQVPQQAVEAEWHPTQASNAPQQHQTNSLPGAHQTTYQQPTYPLAPVHPQPTQSFNIPPPTVQGVYQQQYDPYPQQQQKPVQSFYGYEIYHQPFYPQATTEPPLFEPQQQQSTLQNVSPEPIYESTTIEYSSDWQYRNSAASSTYGILGAEKSTGAVLIAGPRDSWPAWRWPGMQVCFGLAAMTLGMPALPSRADLRSSGLLC